MPNRAKLSLIIAASIGGFALLLLIISVGTVTWLDDNNGSTVGLFRQCYGGNTTVLSTGGYDQGCYSNNQVTQGGLSVFGLLLLAFGVIALIAAIFSDHSYILGAALVLFYFSSMFVMAAYATWGVYSRSPALYIFPLPANLTSPNAPHTSMGASYNLCVAAHYFLWTALTILAFGAGYTMASDPSPSSG